jgi:tetratricopeptide (TPR) repeat protein
MSTLAAALSHHQAGRLPEAESIYRGILAAEPENADALHLLGVLERQSSRPSSAVELIRRAIELNGKVPDFHNNLGTVLLDTGEMDEAVKAFMRALHLRPRYPEAALNLANTLARTGKAEEAANFYRAVMAFDPRNADAASNLGVMLSQLGRLDEAVASYQQATRIRPEHADAHYNLGNALLALGRGPEAIASYEAAIAVRPSHPESHYNLGNALVKEARLVEAEASFRRALAERSNYVEALNNLGKTLQSLGRHDEALRSFEEALTLASNHGDIHYNHALLLLLMGRHKEGWAEHEWRWRAKGFTGLLRGFAQPLWDGSEKSGATLLLHAEQGLGDTIQFAHYASFARARVGRVVLEVPRPLVPLMDHIPGVDQLVAMGDALPDFEIQAPLLTLPHLLGEEIGLPIQYLSADPERVQRWSERLGEKGPRVGLVWAGNPKHANDRNRSLQATMLRPLIEQGRASFFCLQLAPRFADLVAAGLGDHVTDLSAELTDLAETAAALSALDLLITVDTAVAHLAGALGRPVSLMIPFAPDWRWGLGSAETRWYPQTRLFRQAQPGEWDPVILQVLEDLNKK